MKKKQKSLILTQPLLDAAEEGDLDGLKSLLKRGVSVRAVDVDDSSTLMHIASRCGHRQMVKHLLSKGSDIEATDSERQTPLHLASKHGHAKVVQFLVNNNANLNAQDLNDEKPIHLATREGHLHIMDVFLYKGQSVDVDNGHGLTSLHMATMQGDLVVVQYLVDCDANICFESDYQGKPIHQAAENGHLDIMELFLNEETNVDERDSQDRTPLHLAAFYNKFEMVKFLLHKGANVQAQCSEGKYPIHYAARFCCKDVVELLINHGSHIDVVDKYGYTPLHLAASEGRLDVVEFLIDQIAKDHLDGPMAKWNIDTQNTTGRTALQSACQSFRHKHEVITCLLDAGAGSDIKDNDGRTASFHYVKNLDNLLSEERILIPKIFKKLCDDTIVIDDKERQTVAHIICSKIYLSVQIVKRVLEHQKNFNVEDVHGKTPLNCLTDKKHLWSNDQRKELIQFLVDRGAYLKAIDCQRIISNFSLKMALLTDVKFCSQSIVNMFNDKESPMFHSLAENLLPLEHVKVNDSQVKTIERALGEVIRDKEPFDISNMAFLTVLHIVSSQKSCHTCTELFNNVLVDFAVLGKCN